MPGVRALLLLSALTLGSAGCELVADFDRDKIPAGDEPSDASTLDAADGRADAATDAAASDASVTDAGDAGEDADEDAGADGSGDAG